MEQALIAKQLFERIFNIPILMTKDKKSALADFEQCHCFHPQFQKQNTQVYLQNFISEMEPNGIYEIWEPLETIITLFCVGEYLVIIGPYLEKETNLQEMESILSGMGISSSYLSEYRFYRTRYCIVDTEYIFHISLILVEMLDGNIADYFISKAKRSQGQLNFPKTMYVNQDSVKNIDTRYAFERQFIQKLKTGNVEETLTAYRNLSSTPSPLYLSKDGNTPQTAGSTALRTTIRITAAEAGVPPVVIDSISQQYAQKMYSPINRQRKKKENYLEQMIRDVCEEIKKSQQNHFSFIVQKTIAYIQINLGSALNVQIIAKHMHVSAGHLSKQFKADTGTTIINYITDMRTQKAAELLATTSHTVQDISNYVGYSDNNYFVKVFKSRYHMTPTEYRKQFQNRPFY